MAQKFIPPESGKKTSPKKEEKKPISYKWKIAGAIVFDVIAFGGLYLVERHNDREAERRHKAAVRRPSSDTARIKAEWHDLPLDKKLELLEDGKATAICSDSNVVALLLPSPLSPQNRKKLEHEIALGNCLLTPKP